MRRRLIACLIPAGDARQALRMRRFLTASAASLVLLLLLLYCAQAGLLARRAALLTGALVVACNLLFFALFRSGLNRRFGDASLTAEQLIAASATLLYAVAHGGPARPAFLITVLTVFLFGVFRLPTRKLLLIALFDVAVYAALIVWPLAAGLVAPAAGAVPIDVRVDLLMLLMLGVSLGGFSLMAGQVVALRASVEQRNRELGHAVQTLEQRQDDLSELQKLAKLGTWSRHFDAAGRPETGIWSEQMFHLFGLHPEQPVPQRDVIRAMMHPHDRALFDRYLTTTDQLTDAIEARIVRRGSGVVWVRMQRHNVTSPEGTLLRQYGTMFDITDAKQGERRLMMQHVVTRVLAEAGTLNDAMPAILGVVGAAQEWVAAACWRVTQDGTQFRCVDTWQLDEVPLAAFSARQRDTRIATADERDGLLLTAWRTQRPHWIEDVMQAAGFGRRDAAAAAGLHGAFVMPVVAGGAVLRLIEFYSHDARTPDPLLIDLAQSLGNQIGQFILRRSAEAALAGARENLEMAVKASGIGFWDWQIGTDVTNYSEHIGPMLGYTTASMPPGQAQFAALVHPDDRAALRQAHAAGIKHGKPYSMELRLRLRNGEWCWFQGRAQVFFDAAGRAVRMAGSLADIEAHKRLDRAKDEFVGTVSHELRTPLTAIRGALGLLDGGVAGQLPAEAKELVQVALSGSERLSCLVNDVLNLAKIEAGATALAAAPLLLDDVIAAALRANQTYVREFGVALRSVTGTRGAQVKTDAGRLMQVLTNLISNAAKFSPAGSEVQVTTARAGKWLRLSVIDHGSGIPENFRTRLFEKFAQADGTDARARQGSGLGLSICRALVVQMGGRIDFAGTAGGGSTFIVELPEYDPDTTQEYAVKQDAARAAAGVRVPLGAAPLRSARAQSAPAQSAPVQGAPVQGAPVLGAPVQGAPVQGAPV